MLLKSGIWNPDLFSSDFGSEGKQILASTNLYVKLASRHRGSNDLLGSLDAASFVSQCTPISFPKTPSDKRKVQKK